MLEVLFKCKIKNSFSLVKEANDCRIFFSGVHYVCFNLIVR